MAQRATNSEKGNRMTSGSKTPSDTPKTSRTSKRGNNEGSLSRRPDGRWEARITLEDGRRKSFYGKTRQEAARQLTQALRDRDAGLPIVGEKQTLAQYLALWLKDIAPTIRPRSLQRYEEAVRLHVNPHLGSTTLSRLAPQQLQTFYTVKLEEGLAPATVARLHAVLRRALGEAFRLGLVQRNVATLVRAPRPTHHEMRTLSPEQARTLLEAARDDPLEALYVLAITTGMRRGELLALHWADVNLDERFLQVRYTVQHVKGGGYVFAPPKTPRSRRKIALTGMAVEALRRHRRRQLEQRVELGAEWHDEDLIFTSADGHAIRANHVLQRMFTPLLQRAGLPLIRFHDLRHTAATLLLLQGVHPKVVSEMLGHATVSMTLDTYSHVLPDMQKDATAALDRLLVNSGTEQDATPTACDERPRRGGTSGRL
jgi:integrase